MNKVVISKTNTAITDYSSNLFSITETATGNNLFFIPKANIPIFSVESEGLLTLKINLGDFELVITDYPSLYDLIYEINTVTDAVYKNTTRKIDNIEKKLIDIETVLNDNASDGVIIRSERLKVPDFPELLYSAPTKKRTFLTIQNQGNKNLFIGFDDTVGSNHMIIPPDGCITWDSDFVPQGEIWTQGGITMFIYTACAELP